ncbi:hypothetical protein Nepgr_009740 [Nepenthes gracilis]|uniref:Ribosomal RNA-processing protein 14/surfeit locus protein 6 C-terminal domain-containing protein n=1 Tax=Nepenthes gracilis TaxID=150966 RepID=A0AAD3SBR6_NEPGR|nr:hypothetical protein Nepgr_009740 [Nepenthes gracilis]
MVKKHSWKAARVKAIGVKVHDNPKLLKESIKKEERKHKKSVKMRKERVETREMKKQKKQEKRKENIKPKIGKKKMREIEKR